MVPLPLGVQHAASAVRLSHAEFGNIARLNEATGRYQQVVHYGDVSPEFWAALSSVEFGPDRRTLIGRTLIERRPVHIHDVLADPEYLFPVAQRVGGYRTILGVPMLRDGLPIGVIVVNRRVVQPFTDREIALLSTFADQAVLAVANVSLFQTVERQRARRHLDPRRARVDVALRTAPTRLLHLGRTAPAGLVRATVRQSAHGDEPGHRPSVA